MKTISAALLVLCLCTSVFAAGGRFGALVETYENLHLGDARPVSNVTYATGHMKLVLTSGSAAPVLAGKETVGIFFKGDGSFRYETDDAIEVPLVNYNVKHDAHLKAEGDTKHTVLSDNISEVLLLAAGDALPQIAAGTAGSLSADFASHLEYFDRDVNSPRSHLFVVQKLSFPQAKVVRAEMRAGRDNLVYQLDGAEDHDEVLYRLHTPDALDSVIKARLYAQVLSDQPDHDRKAGQKPPFYVTDVNYTLTADGDDAKLTVTETLSRQGEGQQAIRFDQVQAMHVKAGTADREFHVLSVVDGEGHSLPFHLGHNEMLVGLEGVKGDAPKLTFQIEGNFLYRPNNDNAWELGVWSWFPQPLSFGGQYYTVHSLVKVKKPFTAFAPGTTVVRKEEGDYNVVEDFIDKPVQFAVVQGGKYEYTEEKKGDLTIRVATYSQRNDRAAKQLTSLAFSIIDYYQWFLGPFPFNEFNIIQVNSYGYGQAPPGTMFITNEAFDSMTSEVNKYFSQGANERFAHEIAHQYWAHVVKMPNEEEQWLTESFAEYCAALALKKFKGDGVYDRLVAHWKQLAKEAGDYAPIPLANRIGGDRMIASQARYALLYAKGPYLLYTIHKQIGDNAFLTFLKSYQKTFRWKFGTTNDVAGMLEFVTKKDFKPFIDQYFWGTAMPQ